MNEEKNYNSWDVWSSVLDRMRELWRPLILVHLAYLGLGVILLSPLVGLIVQLPFLVSGRPALADQDILYFFLSPTGLICLILITGIIIAVVATEQASMLAVAAAARGGHRISVFKSISFARKRIVQILVLSVILAGRVLALVAPFLAAGAFIAWLLITRYDINYYLTERPPAFWAVVAASCVLITVMAAILSRKVISWSLTFPLVVLVGLTPWQSFAESARSVAGAGWVIFRIFAIWLLAAISLSTLVLASIETLGSWIVPIFMDSLGPLAMVLGGLLIVWFFANTIVTALTSMSFALLLVELADRHKIDLSLEPSGAVTRDGATGEFKMTPAMLTLMLGGALVASLIAGSLLLDNMRIDDDVLVIAHRGAAGKAPENTLASVRQAITDGADWIEIDVQETADGEVVVFHDSDFMKLSGVDLKIWNATVADLAKIDVGSWFDAKFSSERVPTLRAVLDEARGKVKVVIELKYYGHDQMLEERVVQIVERANMVPEIAAMSLKYEGVQKLQAMRPAWSVGLLVAKGLGDLTKLDANFLAVHANMAGSTFIRRTHRAGKRVLVWTVNDTISMSRLISLGVDGVITDEPALARRVLADRIDLSPVERLLVHVAALFDLPAPRAYRDDSP